MKNNSYFCPEVDEDKMGHLIQLNKKPLKF